MVAYYRDIKRLEDFSRALWSIFGGFGFEKKKIKLEMEVNSDRWRFNWN